jgi:hypothetical protein
MRGGAAAEIPFEGGSLQAIEGGSAEAAQVAQALEGGFMNLNGGLTWPWSHKKHHKRSHRR